MPINTDISITQTLGDFELRSTNIESRLKQRKKREDSRGIRREFDNY